MDSRQTLLKLKVLTKSSITNNVPNVPMMTDETVHLVYDNLDFLRGVEVFLNFIPAASIEGLRLGNVERGAMRSNQAARSKRSLFITLFHADTKSRTNFSFESSCA